VTEHKVVLGQYATDVKSNEITAIPELLKLLDVRGAVVTIDAIGCQKGIAKQIVEKGADYLFGLKGNQPTLHEEVVSSFDAATSAALRSEPRSFFESVDKGHGRLEVRRTFVLREVSWLMGSSAWPGLRSMVLVESERTIRGETSLERRAYISSLDAPAERFGLLVRRHWHVENKLHWVLDVTFGEDRGRVGRKNGAENLAILRKLAVTLFSRAPKRGRVQSLAMKKRRASWSFPRAMEVLCAGLSEP
jgi:predicted transposase YbfD/YdcC